MSNTPNLNSVSGG